MNEINYNKGIVTISELVDKYKNKGRFTKEIVNSVTNAINGQDLKIAVIGKMNAGKSSFTNALIFRSNVLPSGSEPTTVTLTEIAYTDDPSRDSRVEVELLTPSDIGDLQTNATSENGQISKNARELLDSLNRIPGGYEQYVSRGVIEIDLEELKKFTSGEGELSGLAKKVTIYKNLSALKGLWITDTPGFNDPVNSRCEATKRALKDCNVILFIHDYLDKYDQDEISILLEQIDYTGVSMLVDIINKMDMIEDINIYDWPSEIPIFDKKKEEAIKQIPKEGVKELLSKGKTSFVSALMALIGYEVLDHNQKKADGKECFLDDNIKEFFIEFQKDFSELKSAEDFVEFSNIAGIVSIINQLSSDKSKYLVNYPIQTLIGLLKSVADVILQEVKDKQNDLNVLSQGAAEARRKLDAINNTFRALGNSIDSPLLATTLRNRIREKKHKIQQLRDSKSADEFTPANYEKEGSIFTNGPENRNLARYKGFLGDIDNEVRNSLEELKDSFSTECDAYVNKLVEGLVTDTINLEDRKLFASVLIGLLKSEISKGLPIVVNPDEPTDCLYGAGTQDSLYRSDFLQRRSDTIIEDKYLKLFRSFVDGTISSDVLRNAITDQIEKLKAKLKGAIDYSPTEMDFKIEELNREIENLKLELDEVKIDIKLLEELKFEE